MRMAQNLILLPVLVQVMLTFAVMILLVRARARSMRERGQGIEDMALAGEADWSTAARRVSASFRNQFELPVLFYVACAFALAMRAVDVWFFALAWLFVASRVAHAAVHIGPNVVKWRFLAFLPCLIALVAMWLLLGWQVLSREF